MSTKNPLITDEHIVAYLDGELKANAEFEQDLRTNPELLRSAKEYAAIGNAFAASRSDSRFMLSSRIDARTYKMLVGALKKLRKEVRVASKAPNAEPVHLIPALRNIKYLWAKRAAIGFAFAGLLVSLWFNFNPKQNDITQVPMPQKNVIVPAPVAPSMLPVEAPPPQFASKPSITAVSHLPKAAPAHTNTDIAMNTSYQTEAPPPTHEQTEPADIMISHRYIKLIKATPVVMIKMQDRVAD